MQKNCQFSSDKAVDKTKKLVKYGLVRLNDIMKSIFVLTGGGLAPALNPTLYGVIDEAKKRGWTVIGGLFGWASLQRNGRHVDLRDMDVEPLKNLGGTLLRSSRTNPMKTADGIAEVKERLRELAIDAVVAIGGDDTLGAGHALAAAGIPIVGIPKTIDNDLSGTYCTPGFPSAARELADFTKEIREEAAYALSRIFVIESLGMRAGWLAAAAAYGHADIILPPERPIALRAMLDRLSERYEKNGNYAVVVVAQEAQFDEPLAVHHDKQPGEQYDHVRQSYICLALKEKIKAALGVDTKALYPGNFLETGRPIDRDRDLAIQLGRHAVAMVADGRTDAMPCIIRTDDTSVALAVGDIELGEVVGKEKYRTLPPSFFDWDLLQPTPEFFRYMEPLLGPYRPPDDDYAALVKKITSQIS